MRMECPYCWQHYEISQADRDKDFVCICCDQSFNGRDALIIPGNYQKLWMGLAIGGTIFAILLLSVNIFLWRQLRHQSDAINALAAVEAGKPVATLVPNGLKTQDKESLQSIEQQLRQLQEKLDQLSGTLTILTEEQGRVSGKTAAFEEKLGVITKGLADARYQVNSLNIANRLGELEKSTLQLEKEVSAVRTAPPPKSPASP